jgi:hypothetical protein
MRNNLFIIGTLILLCFTMQSVAQLGGNNPGQVIQINTRFHYFVGNPSFTLIIRDLDHNQNMPYLFDITRGENHWVVFTYGRNYLIEVSKLQIETYQPRYNTYQQYRLNNFCHLESNGRIIRGESMYITIEGDLTPNPNTFSCHVSIYPESHFPIVRSDP